MIPAAVVFAYLATALYLGIFAFRRSRQSNAEDYFLAGRSLGPAVFLLSLFGTNMTAFSILGASGHAFSNGIVTFGLMASASALIIPVSLLTIGTRLWALGRRNGFMTPVQMFRDRWECGHIGTIIFIVQAALLVPYIIIAVKGGGTTLEAVSGGIVPYWLGGAIVSLVVMGYVFFGGMRGTAWVNAMQTSLFLVFGTIAFLVIAAGMGGFRAAIQSLAVSPSTAYLLTRERISMLYFFSYTFIPLSTIAFPHVGIFCLTARRLGHFRKTVVLYPICLLAIWLPSVFLGVVANAAREVPTIEAKLAARAELASPALDPAARDRLRGAAAGDDVILRVMEGYAPTWLFAILGACVMAAVMASDSQILALSTMFTEDVFAFYGGKARFGQTVQVHDRPRLHRRHHARGVRDRAQSAAVDLRGRDAVRLCRVCRAFAVAGRGAVLETQYQVGRPGEHVVDRDRGADGRRDSTRHSVAAARRRRAGLVRIRRRHRHADAGGRDGSRLPAGRADDDRVGAADGDRVAVHGRGASRRGHARPLFPGWCAIVSSDPFHSTRPH